MKKPDPTPEQSAQIVALMRSFRYVEEMLGVDSSISLSVHTSLFIQGVLQVAAHDFPSAQALLTDMASRCVALADTKDAAELVTFALGTSEGVVQRDGTVVKGGSSDH